MKNRKKEIAALTAGLLAGSLLTGPAAQAAQTLLTASPSAQKFYVDGQQVRLEAYSINGYNYIKLADLSSLVGFDLAYDSTTNSVYIGERPAAEPVKDGTVTLPTNGSRYVPKAGDVIRCNDGTNYTIKDVRRWEMNISPLPDLPSATCDWSKFPTLELPQAEARHFTDQDRDILFVKNLYETRRMQYTIYNALGKEPSAWKDGKPLATVQLTIPADLDPYTASMWPWHGTDLENGEYGPQPAKQRILHRSLGLLPQRSVPAYTIQRGINIKLHITQRWEYPKKERPLFLRPSKEE